MSAEVFNRLVRNIKRDGVLTSAPLVHSARDGEVEALRILSGHHRVKAALEAGIHEGACLVLEGEVTPARLRAIQLSHNALVREDDMAQLQKLWASLPVDEQLYSGLSDGTFKLLGELPDLANLRPVTNAMQTLNFVFLPADRDMILEAIRKAGKRKNTSTLFAAAETFDTVFEGLVEVKGRFDLIASSMGLLKLVDLALQQLRQIEAEEADTADAPTGETPGRPPTEQA